MTETCNGDDGDGAAHRSHLWHLGANYAVFRSELRFDDESRATLLEHAVGATIEYRVTPTLTLFAGGGGILGGHVTFESDPHRLEVNPGGFASVGGAYRAVDGVGRSPFVILSLSLSQSFGSTQAWNADGTVSGRARLAAGDGRIGVTIGKNIGSVFSPYLSIRGFGGPVFWRLRGNDVIGSDRHHYQVAVGGAAALGRGIDAFAEYAPLGEQRLSLGVGLSL